MVDIIVVGYAWFRNMDYGKDNNWSLTNTSMTPKTTLNLSRTRDRDRTGTCVTWALRTTAIARSSREQ